MKTNWLTGFINCRDTEPQFLSVSTPGGPAGLYSQERQVTEISVLDKTQIAENWTHKYILQLLFRLKNRNV